jgi:hypothetical protein
LSLAFASALDAETSCGSFVKLSVRALVQRSART